MRNNTSKKDAIKLAMSLIFIAGVLCGVSGCNKVDTSQTVAPPPAKILSEDDAVFPEDSTNDINNAFAEMNPTDALNTAVLTTKVLPPVPKISPDATLPTPDSTRSTINSRQANAFSPGAILSPIAQKPPANSPVQQVLAGQNQATPPKAPQTAGPTKAQTAGPTKATTAIVTAGPTTIAPAGPTTATPAIPTTIAPAGPTTIATAGPTAVTTAGPTTVATAGPTTAVPSTVPPTIPTTAAPVQTTSELPPLTSSPSTTGIQSNSTIPSLSVTMPLPTAPATTSPSIPPASTNQPSYQTTIPTTSAPPLQPVMPTVVATTRPVATNPVTTATTTRPPVVPAESNTAPNAATIRNMVINDLSSVGKWNPNYVGVPGNGSGSLSGRSTSQQYAQAISRYLLSSDMTIVSLNTTLNSNGSIAYSFTYYY